MQRISTALVYVRAFGIWCVMLLAAFANGAFRELVIVPRWGERVGHVVGVVVLGGIIWVLAWRLVKSTGALPARTLLLVGLFWVTLSLLFEFGFFHYAMQIPWSKLLADYNVLQGRLLLVVWISTLISPLVCGRAVYGRPRPGGPEGPEHL